MEEKLRFGSQEDEVMSSHVSPGDLPRGRRKEGDTGSQRGRGRLRWVRGSSRAQRRNSRRQGEGRGKVGHGAVFCSNFSSFLFPRKEPRSEKGGKGQRGQERKEQYPLWITFELHLHRICCRGRVCLRINVVVNLWN